MHRDVRAPRPREAGTLSAPNPSLPLELLGFVRRNKKWWLLPILGTFLIVSALLLLTTTAAAPFIYTFF
jgi:hypothetical protein